MDQKETKDDTDSRVHRMIYVLTDNNHLIDRMKIYDEGYKSIDDVQDGLLRCRMKRVFARWIAGDITLTKRDRYVIGYYLKIHDQDTFMKVFDEILNQMGMRGRH